MEYLNFELRIGIKNGDQYPVTVIDSPVGETSAMVSFPMNDSQFRSHLQIIENSRGKGKTRKQSLSNKSLKRGGMEFSPDEEIISTKEFGTILFERLFSDEIKSSFRASLLLAHKEEKGLRIKLGVEAADLSALPWEYLYDKEAGDYLCLSVKTPLVRILELSKPAELLTIQPPLKILGVISSPSDLYTLDVEREKANMNMAIEHLIGTGIVNLTWLEGKTWRDLYTALDSDTWHMMHFIGHGGFDTNTGEGTIALENEDGSANHLSSTELGRMLDGHDSMRLVILNSCEGARTNNEDLFSSTGANLIRKGIPAVVSMQYEITDHAALEFSRTFYEKIANGTPVDTALQKARKAITFADKNSEEWATPVLHMRSTDGKLFDIDNSGAIFSDAQKKNQQKPIVNSDSVGSPNDYPLSSTEDKGLTILLKKVRNYWINGVLEPSIKHSDLMKLGFDNMPDMVDSPWGSSPIAENNSINTVFNEVGRSLLILGEPGAGKTTLLLTLAKELLNQYESTPGLPLPVVFNLSSWTQSNKSILEWLADELSTKYMIPKKFGIDLIQNNRLLPLLDGLDEVGRENRNLCVNAINSFLKETGVMGVVVCCRFKEYLQLDSKLIVNGALRVRLLTTEKIMNYLSIAGPAFSGLKELLKRDSSFLKLAETPLMLSLMMQTFRNFNADQIIGEKLQSINTKRDQLMKAYVKNQFRMAENGTDI